MTARGSGHIVTMVSIGALRMAPTAAVYCATQFAVRAISDGLRQEHDAILFSPETLAQPNILGDEGISRYLASHFDAELAEIDPAILIGSQVLNFVVISFGGEHYIQHFLRSFDNEMVVFLVVMPVLFILGFVLDFLEIIHIVVPIVGPVIYGGSLDPKWATIMIAVNLQTSFLTPPFGFALFHLRGVAPPEVTTQAIYRGVPPFVLLQVLGLAMPWSFPSVVTIPPDLLR